MGCLKNIQQSKLLEFWNSQKVKTLISLPKYGCIELCKEIDVLAVDQSCKLSGESVNKEPVRITVFYGLLELHCSSVPEGYFESQGQFFHPQVLSLFYPCCVLISHWPWTDMSTPTHPFTLANSHTANSQGQCSHATGAKYIYLQFWET